MGSSGVMAQLRKIFTESVLAVNPVRLIATSLKLIGNDLWACGKTYPLNGGKVYVVGFGKAVLGMASQVERVLGSHLASGIICVPVGIRDTFRSDREQSLGEDSVIRVFEGAKNNLPDERAEQGADAIVELVQSLTDENDKLLVLISGGGSALLPKAKSGISLEEKLKAVKLVASAGADITELNTLRKKLSAVKGGKLACLSHPTTTISLILSDVLSDPLDVIASGPTVPNRDTNDSALKVVMKYNLTRDMPESVMSVLNEPEPELNCPVLDNNFIHVDNYLIGNNAKAVAAAKETAERLGFISFVLSLNISGLVQDVAQFYTDLLTGVIGYVQDRDIEYLDTVIRGASQKYPFECNQYLLRDLKVLAVGESKRICIIAGGEPTVVVSGEGKGGRNQELALVMCLKLQDLKRIFVRFFERYDVAFLSAGTDGVDGPTDAAGAVVDDAVLDGSTRSGPDAVDHLARNDSHTFFSNLRNGSCLIRTGHTGTNVADIHILTLTQKSCTSSE